MSAATNNITWAAYHETEAMTTVQSNGSGLVHIPFSHQDIHRSKMQFSLEGYIFHPRPQR